MKVGVLKTISAAIFGLVAAGCSTHPIPDDVSRYSTADIVWHIRCEAKGAVRRNIRELLVNAYEVV